MTQQELLNYQLGTKSEIKENTKTVEIEPLEGTPFNMVKNNEEWFLCYGKYKISESYISQEHLLAAFASKPWEITINLCATLISAFRDFEKDVDEKLQDENK